MKGLTLKPGDEVTVCSSDGDPYSIVTVVRENTYGKGGWITSGGEHWTKSGLRDRGALGSNRTKIIPTTDEHRRVLWFKKMRAEVMRPETWSGASDDTIERVATLLGWRRP